MAKNLMIALWPLLICPTAQAIENDKEKHLMASSLISTTTYTALRTHDITRARSYWSAVGVTLAVGIAKELTDEHFDNEDLKYDAAGALLAPVLFLAF